MFIKNKLGFSLIEILLALLIVFLLLIPMYNVFKAAIWQKKINDTIQLAELMEATVGKLYVGGPNNYRNLTTQVVINTNSVPNNVIAGKPPNQYVKNDLGGKIEVYPYTDGNNHYTGFYVQVKAATEYCSLLAKSLRGNNSKILELNGIVIYQKNKNDQFGPLNSKWDDSLINSVCENAGKPGGLGLAIFHLYY